MLIDILKGWTATNLAFFIGVSTTGAYNSPAYINYALALGIAAVMGHLFPIFAGFRGGKGIATLFGMILAINLAGGAFLCRYFHCHVINYPLCVAGVYLGRICVPGVRYFCFPNVYPLCDHLRDVYVFADPCYPSKKIERLLKGTESKVNLFKKKVA